MAFTHLSLIFFFVMAPKPNKRNDKRRKAKKATKPLTKKQVVSYIRELKKLDMSQLCQCVKDKSLQDHHIMTSEIRSKLIGELCSEVIVEKFFDKYCYLYEKSHKGQFKDRYAMFQIDWNRFVTQFFDKSSESYKIVENIIGSSYLVSDISAAIHTIAKHLYGSMSLELQKLKTSALKPTSDTCQKDDIMSQLAFCGACVRKMYKKAKKHNHVEYLKLVHVVLMPKKQRLDFIKYNIITSPITKLWFIPKLALLPYIKHLNESIKESCSETSFALYGKQLVEVCFNSFSYCNCYQTQRAMVNGHFSNHIMGSWTK